MSQSGTYGNGGGGGSSGALILIQTQTASGATSLTFTSGISSTYNNYEIFFDNVATTNTPNFVVAQLSTDGGATYINTNYLNNNIGASVGLALFSTQSNSGDPGFTYGNTGLYNLTSGSNYVTAAAFSGAFYDTFVGNVIIPPATSSAYTVTSTTVNALQIVTDDGTAFSGTFSLYGIVM